jgi:uncharacterized protein YndB with AHSA1/START domain
MPKTLEFTRLFDAPQELVWRAWTEPEMLMKWWGPKNFTAPVCKVDLRVGGKYLFCMRGAARPNMPEQDFWSTGTYKEISPMDRIVCTDSFSDAEGNIISASKYGMSEDIPLESLVTITFDIVDPTKTKLTISYSFDSDKEYDSMIATGINQGWNEQLDKLAEALK